VTAPLCRFDSASRALWITDVTPTVPAPRASAGGRCPGTWGNAVCAGSPPAIRCSCCRYQHRPGVRNRRLHAGIERRRRSGSRVLQRPLLYICSACPGRAGAGDASRFVCLSQAARYERMPFRQPPRSEERPLGAGPDGSKDAGVRLGKTSTGREFRVSRVDGFKPCRHIKFVSLREDKDPRKVVRE
jgi:hypothetical protein